MRLRPEELGRQLKPHSYSQSPVGSAPAPRGGSRRPLRALGGAQTLTLQAARAGPDPFGTPFLGTGLVPAPALGLKSCRRRVESRRK